jgi:hypothetical protein
MLCPSSNVLRLSQSNYIMVPMVSSYQNCIQADGTLKLVDAQSNANRRPSDIQYVKIACNVVFSKLMPGNTQLYPFTFYVWLHMENQTITNSTGVDI